MQSVQINQLKPMYDITTEDFFPDVDSGSAANLTTYRADFVAVGTWSKTYATASQTFTASLAYASLTASFAMTASHCTTASYLLYTGSRLDNGTASYALHGQRALTASYFDGGASTVAYATYAVSASWASSSLSASCISASNVIGNVISASHAITSSLGITASYALGYGTGSGNSLADSASWAITASTADFVDFIATEIKNIYGPFVADATVETPTRAYGQYDELKRSVAFILAEDADVIVKCYVNYDVERLVEYDYRTRFIGVQLLAEDAGDPITSNIANSEFDDLKVIGLRFDTGDYANRYSGVAEFSFVKSNLIAGQYRVYVVPLITSKTIGSAYHADDTATYNASGSNAQWVTYLDFLDDSITIDRGGIQWVDAGPRIHKFINSVQVYVYSTKSVIQGIYAPVVPTWKIWNLTYRVNSNTITNGQFEYVYDYYSALNGGGTAEWIDPYIPPINQTKRISLCLPSDHLNNTINVTYGPIGVITSGPTLTTTDCTP